MAVLANNPQKNVGIEWLGQDRWLALLAGLCPQQIGVTGHEFLLGKEIAQGAEGARGGLGLSATFAAVLLELAAFGVGVERDDGEIDPPAVVDGHHLGLELDAERKLLVQVGAAGNAELC